MNFISDMLVQCKDPWEFKSYAKQTVYHGGRALDELPNRYFSIKLLYMFKYNKAEDSIDALRQFLQLNPQHCQQIVDHLNHDWLKFVKFCREKSARGLEKMLIQETDYNVSDIQLDRAWNHKDKHNPKCWYVFVEHSDNHRPYSDGTLPRRN